MNKIEYRNTMKASIDLWLSGYRDNQSVRSRSCLWDHSNINQTGPDQQDTVSRPNRARTVMRHIPGLLGHYPNHGLYPAHIYILGIAPTIDNRQYNHTIPLPTFPYNSS